MLKILAFALLAFWQLLPPRAPAVASCAGPDPALTSVAVKGVTTNGGINQYRLIGTVVNVGRKKQSSNVLQFVDIYRDGEKMNEIGIPPLKARQSYTFGWVFERSQDSGNGTTTLVFTVRAANAAGASQDCNSGNDRTTVTF